MTAPTLREIQSLLWKLITAPEGTEAGLRSHDIPRERLEAVVHGDENLGSIERVDVYADMYFYRLLDALRGDYPAVCLTLGDDGFHDLVTDYLLAHPSGHPSLRHLGEHLPDFVEHRPLGERQPWLPDLARLEWARVDIFDAPDAEPVTRADLMEIGPEAWPELRLRPIAAMRRLTSPWPVHMAWAAADDGTQPRSLEARPTLLKVWRQNHVVYHSEIEPDEDAALTTVASGGTWAQVCEQLAASGDLEAATTSALEILTGWLDDGLLVEAEVAP